MRKRQKKSTHKQTKIFGSPLDRQATQPATPQLPRFARKSQIRRTTSGPPHPGTGTHRTHLIEPVEFDSREGCRLITTDTEICLFRLKSVHGELPPWRGSEGSQPCTLRWASKQGTGPRGHMVHQQWDVGPLGALGNSGPSEARAYAAGRGCRPPTTGPNHPGPQIATNTRRRLEPVLIPMKWNQAPNI